MRVMFASAELAPVAAVGGLAQAAAGLVTELRRQDVTVDVVLPDYDGIELAGERTVGLDVPSWAGPAAVRVGAHPTAGELHLVSSPGIARRHPYLQPDGEGWPDNTARFFAFSRAVAALAGRDPPDVLHLNDWHTATTLAAFPCKGAGGTPTVLSLHNVAYQGFAAGEWRTVLGLRAEHYEWYGGTNPLSGAIALADAVVAVSPTYADEIRTPAGGFGLDAALRDRGDAVAGILNGIDTAVWDPATDPALAARYSAADPVADRLAAKAANRAAVAPRIGSELALDDGVPLAVMVTRLTAQKGVDLVAELVPALAAIPLRLVLLGSGEAELAAALRTAAAAVPRWFGFVDAYDDQLAHLLFGAADVYVMPSRFEPCGLAQMQAMRYGAIPVVTDVGGLHDTVVDADHHRHGTGFTSPEPTGAAVTAALFRAARAVGHRRRREGLVTRAMAIDWSWRGPGAEYVALYHRLTGRPE